MKKWVTVGGLLLLLRECCRTNSARKRGRDSQGQEREEDERLQTAGAMKGRLAGRSERGTER